MVTTSVLKNNVLLITESVEGARTVSIGFWFAAGSRYERDGQHGISHFCEHLLFKGCAAFGAEPARSAHEIAAAFDRIGGYVNAFTEREAVCVYCTVPAESSSVATALSVLSGMAEHADFPEEELERDRAVVKSEIVASLDDSEEAAFDAAASAVWPGQSVSASISGSMSDLDGLLRGDVCAWYENYFAKGELTVCAAGAVSEELLRPVLETLSVHRPVRRFHFGSPPVWKPGTCFVSAPFRSQQLFLLYPCVLPETMQDYCTMSVMNALAGDTMSSRLFEALREKSGFCYTVYSFFTFYEDAALWSAYCSCEKRNALPVSRILHAELEALRTGGVTEDELTAAKEHLCGEEIIGSEDMEFRMKRLQRNHALGFPQVETDDIVLNIRAVSQDSVRSMLNALFNIEKKAFVSYGPALSAKTRRDMLT